MKYLMSAILVLALVFAVSNAAIDAKQLFLDKKCNSCHSIDALKIAKTNANSKAADLSTVGKVRTAEFLTKYLKKEADIDGKKHGVAFKGTDEEFKAMVDWLAGLK